MMAVKRMRGKPGSTILLTIVRKKRTETFADQRHARRYQGAKR